MHAQVSSQDKTGFIREGAPAIYFWEPRCSLVNLCGATFRAYFGAKSHDVSFQIALYDDRTPPLDSRYAPAPIHARTYLTPAPFILARSIVPSAHQADFTPSAPRAERKTIQNSPQMNACVLSIQAKPALRLRGSKPVARRARVASVTRAVISDPPPIKSATKFTQDWALQVGPAARKLFFNFPRLFSAPPLTLVRTPDPRRRASPRTMRSPGHSSPTSNAPSPARSTKPTSFTASPTPASPSSSATTSRRSRAS
jgi:hypothetical protein